MVRLGRSYPVQRIWKPNPQDISALFGAAGSGSSGVNTTGGTETINWSHTATGPVLAFVNGGAHTGVSLTVTYGGISMTQLGAAAGYYNSGGLVYTLGVFGLLNPPPGAQTVSATCAGTTNSRVVGESVSYVNVSAFGTVTTTTGAGTSLSQTVSSAGGQMVSQAFAAGATSSASISGYTQTSRFSGNSGNVNLLQVGDAPGASSVSFAAGLSTSASWAGIAVPLLPT